MRTTVTVPLMELLIPRVPEASMFDRCTVMTDMWFTYRGLARRLRQL